MTPTESRLPKRRTKLKKLKNRSDLPDLEELERKPTTRAEGIELG